MRSTALELDTDVAAHRGRRDIQVENGKARLGEGGRCRRTADNAYQAGQEECGHNGCSQAAQPSASHHLDDFHDDNHHLSVRVRLAVKLFCAAS